MWNPLEPTKVCGVRWPILNNYLGNDSLDKEVMPGLSPMCPH